MRKISILCSLFLVIGTMTTSPTLNSLAAKPKVNKPRVHWMSFDKAAAFMKENPKKVYIDMYTSTCHWCRVMDRQTLSNRNVVNYLNENFYSIKFNAESKQDITFNGVLFSYDKKRRVHELAIELMNGRLSFPTSIFLEEKFRNPQPVPGFLKVADMEMILKYMAEGKNKTTPWNKYQTDFKPMWK